LEIQVTLHGILRDYLPRQTKGKTILSLSENTTVADIVSQFKIKQTVAAAVNGSQVESSHTLQSGDNLHLFRMIGGG
jgi:sulfur carrier protein ThiS